jgi:hypothetical protein
VLVRRLGGVGRPAAGVSVREDVPDTGTRLRVAKGPIESALESLERTGEQTARIWWPDDHAWCVATEIDLMSTYIGCSRDCADELLARPELETFELDPKRDYGDRLDPARSSHIELLV